MHLLSRLFGFGRKQEPTPVTSRTLVGLSCSPCGDMGLRVVQGRNYLEIQTAIETLLTEHNNTHPPDVAACSLAMELVTLPKIRIQER